MAQTTAIPDQPPTAAEATAVPSATPTVATGAETAWRQALRQAPARKRRADAGEQNEKRRGRPPKPRTAAEEKEKARELREKVKAEKERRKGDRVECYRDAEGQYRWRRVAKNGQVTLAASEGMKQRARRDVAARALNSDLKEDAFGEVDAPS